MGRGIREVAYKGQNLTARVVYRMSQAAPDSIWEPDLRKALSAYKKSRSFEQKYPESQGVVPTLRRWFLPNLSRLRELVRDMQLDSRFEICYTSELVGTLTFSGILGGQVMAETGSDRWSLTRSGGGGTIQVSGSDSALVKSKFARGEVLEFQDGRRFHWDGWTWKDAVGGKIVAFKYSDDSPNRAFIREVTIKIQILNADLPELSLLVMLGLYLLDRDNRRD